MGNLGSAFHFMEGRGETKVLLTGLNGAGKTTILEKLEVGTITRTNVSKTVQVETAKHSNIVLTALDTGIAHDYTKAPILPLLQGTKALIYVVDSSGQLPTVAKARDDLKQLMTLPPLRGIPLLVVGNFQDMNGAADEDAITDKMNLKQITTRHWNLQLTSASQRQGLQDGAEWIGNELENTKK